ncbi:hypothetical protein CMV_030353, partial [Castanea mollissima]
DRLRTSILQYAVEGDQKDEAKIVNKVVDVRNLDANDREEFIQRNFKVPEEDNEKFLKKLRARIDEVEIRLPTVEVRFNHLQIEADCYIGTRALPTLLNTARNIAESALGLCGIRLAEKRKLTILKDVCGIIKPSRMTLLLGPPSSGKTTLLLALAGKLDSNLKVQGQVTYNGHRLDEFVPRKTSAYISQNDVHLGDLTVKETLDYSARFQGVGNRYNLLTELSWRQKHEGIFPEAEVDLFMKAVAMGGAESSLITDYTLKLLGLEICKDTLVGDEMKRGISGGQRKRVTTGEIVVGPARTLFMDEISTGLDSSTTFQIVKCMQQIAHLTETTILMSLLQPDPETFDLFDDIILLSEESIAWTVMTYYTIGYAPEASRFFKQLLVVFLIQQMAAGLFRLMAGLCRTMIIAHTGGALSLLLLFLLGGFILPKGRIPVWWSWGHWVSPLSYGFNALTVNEMLSPRWMDKLASNNITKLGVAVLNNFDVPHHNYWYWIGVTALLAFTILFNILFTFSLMYLNPLGKPQPIISEELGSEQSSMGDSKGKPRLQSNRSINENQMRELQCLETSGESNTMEPSSMAADEVATKRGMILPFTPLTMSFDSVNYYVDMPSEMKDQGVTGDRLQLLQEVTGAFRPGVLTALMGTDIHSPQVTVKESLIYSAFLRLPKEVSDKEKMAFVDEVIELVELNGLKNTIVGLPEITGLSTEQRKRLTIAVELVANPSIIFMDEPTSGLDARAAAIVMRSVRNTVDTGRTVVCTIHQPSIDIFESFDELLLMKRGGQVIYSGQLGQNSCKVVEYFEAIPGVTKIRDKQNPATWMLEVSVASEVRLGIDFAEHYKSSSLSQQTKALVKELSTPLEGSSDLHFPTQYSQSTWGQFKSCLWKHWWTYWRSPHYNLVRYFFTLAAALFLGTIFWQAGTKRENTTDLTMIIGALYVAVLFVGINNCSTVQPVVAVERTVFYRERAAGMYSALPYAIAQVIVEIPYIFVQTTYYSLIVFAMVSFQWTVAKFFWFFFITFFSFLYFTYYGMMTVSITPNHQTAAIFASAFYALFTLFSGFFIPKPRIPKWWTWYYYICPVAWTVYGLIVTQYGDINATIKVPGILPDPTIKWYVENHFGYDLNFMGPTAAILVTFAAFFALMFAVCIKTMNFQNR